MSRQGAAIVDFANSVIHERNWRERVAAVNVERLVALPAPSTGSVIGINSADQAIEIQRRLRDVLNLVVDAAEDARDFQKRAEVAAVINARVKVRIAYTAVADENRLRSNWETEKSSFEELLYVQLATSLAKDGFAVYARCPTCGTFIFRRTAHAQQYCADRCRALAGFRRKRQQISTKPS